MYIMSSLSGISKDGKMQRKYSNMGLKIIKISHAKFTSDEAKTICFLHLLGTHLRLKGVKLSFLIKNVKKIKWNRLVFEES